MPTRYIVKYSIRLEIKKGRKRFLLFIPRSYSLAVILDVFINYFRNRFARHRADDAFLFLPAFENN